jgi:predicted house-cleaning noncanonical NTP pyrophosphatase (MazG superfamily)
MPADGHGSDDAANGAATNDDAANGAAMDDDATDDADEYVGEYDKLVRDDVPAVVRADGNRPVTRRVDGAEYDHYLAAKLREEADEVGDAVTGRGSAPGESDDELLDELADAHAVLDAIAEARGHSMTAVRERARERADARGEFADGVVLERIDPPASGERDDDANQS